MEFGGDGVVESGKDLEGCTPLGSVREGSEDLHSFRDEREAWVVESHESLYGVS